MSAQHDVKGKISKIRFFGNNHLIAVLNSYTIDGESRKQSVVVKGNVYNDVKEGDIIEVQGSWVEDRKWGFQIHFLSYNLIPPTDKDGLINFLASKYIKGIGINLAKNIVDYFDLDTVHVLNNEPERLAEVPGISANKASSIKDSWDKHKNIKDIMVYLLKFGLTQRQATKIYERYGGDARKILDKNPYLLIEDIDGLGFSQIDVIARKMGMKDLDPRRLDAGIIYSLKLALREGSVCLPMNEIVKRAIEQLNLSSERNTLIVERLEELNKIREKVVVDTEISGVPFCYLKNHYDYERWTSEFLRDLVDSEQPSYIVLSSDSMEIAEEKIGYEFAPRQKEGILNALKEKVSIVTGGPGTGKTTIIRAILEIYDANNSDSSSVLLTAPTGRAARRMEEVCGRKAYTLHRALGYDGTAFSRNDHLKLGAGLIIIDEASMIDSWLMYNFIRAVPEHAHVVIIGDVDQLPSVGAGNVLSDLIDSKKFPCVYLNEIFRQAQTSDIITNSHRINKGELPKLNELGSGSDFVFLEASNSTQVQDYINFLVKNFLPNKLGVDSINSAQILTPMKGTEIGVNNLNQMLQGSLNHETLEYKVGKDRFFRLGDRVMQIRNDYTKEVYNGDIGIITDIDKESKTITVNIDGRYIHYMDEEHDFDDLVLAYSMTIHKSQGSEYPVVIIPVMPEHSFMLRRNLIYTGITRSRKLVVLIGQKESIQRAVKNDIDRKRYSFLAHRISEKTLYERSLA